MKRKNKATKEIVLYIPESDELLAVKVTINRVKIGQKCILVARIPKYKNFRPLKLADCIYLGEL